MKRVLLLLAVCLTAGTSAHAYPGPTRTTILSAGPYFSGSLGLGLAYNRCYNKVYEDCFFWTPLGCDGVLANPTFSNFTVSQIADPSSCVDFPCNPTFNTYCSARCTVQCDMIGPERPPIDNCPILIPLGSKQVDVFTDLTRGVRFDIDADGEEDTLSWTDPRANMSFLVLDRNEDGLVNDGTELFGNYTDQRPTNDPNGFIALAEFDLVVGGGNEDGVISEADAIFGQLRLWGDANHDGRSQPEELRTLAQSGVLEIGLSYRETRRVDRFGNALRYYARVVLAGGETRAVDVFFLGKEE